MDVFTPSTKPSVSGSGEGTQVRLAKAQFGDGYSQRILDGLNAIQTRLELSWEYVSPEVAEELDEFFVNHAGLSFLYTLPNQTVQWKYLCETWRKAPRGLGYTYAASLEPSFDVA